MANIKNVNKAKQGADAGFVVVWFEGNEPVDILSGILTRQQARDEARELKLDLAQDDETGEAKIRIAKVVISS